MSFLKENLNSIICGNSEELIKQLPDKCIDLVLTDPPYGIGMDKGVFGGFGSSINTQKRYDGNWDSDIPPKKMFEEILRVGKKVIIFGGNYFAHQLPSSTHWLVWDKKGSINFDNQFSDCELIWTNDKKKSVKKYTVIQQGFINDGDERFHPTQKPERLIKMILDDFASEGDLIADFYSGSGTVCVTAKQNGYNFFGVELNKEFYKKSINRLNGLSLGGQTSIFTNFDDL
jgi:site-specific DNA-methyltransferase (adenine-specific)